MVTKMSNCRKESVLTLSVKKYSALYFYSYILPPKFATNKHLVRGNNIWFSCN